MAAASTQTQDESVDVCPVENVAKLNESGSQTVPLDGMKSSEPPANKPVSDVSARRSAGSEKSPGVADWSCSSVQRSSAVHVWSTTTTTSAAPSFIDRQTARVRPRILTHVIEGFVIQEANEPFPVCICCWFLVVEFFCHCEDMLLCVCQVLSTSQTVVVAACLYSHHRIYVTNLLYSVTVVVCVVQVIISIRCY